MFKEIEIRGLVARRTFIEIDEHFFYKIKSAYENSDWDAASLIENMYWSTKNKTEFYHVTRQSIDFQTVEYTIKGVDTKVFDYKTPVQQVKTIADTYKGKYVVVNTLIGFGLFNGNIKCDDFDMSMLAFPLEYWKGIDKLISCDTVIYDGELYKLDIQDFKPESDDYDIGKFNDDGYLETLLCFSVR
jgi:hypothetical protein